MHRFTIVLAMIGGLSGAASAALAADGRPIEIEAVDGFKLAASYYDPGKPGPAVLLLHQCNSDRTMWNGIASALADSGHHVLTLDYRGYGDSARGAANIEKANQEQRRKMQSMARSDLEEVFEHLLALDGVDGARVATGGASCGGPRSIQLAIGKSGIRTMVFLSTFVGDQVLNSFEQLNDLPILAITAESDGRTTSSLRKLFTASESKKSRLIIYKGDTHGYPLFEQDRRLERTIVNWYRDHLR